MKKLIILLTLTMSIPSVMACQVTTIVTDRGLVSCYSCPNMPITCTKV